MKIERNASLFGLAAASLLFMAASSTAAPPDFDAASHDAAPVVPAGAPGKTNNKSCDDIVAANEKLADIVARLDLPKETQGYYREQSHKLYESARRLPAFVAKARDCLEGRSWICRAAQKYADAHAESAGTSSFAVTWVAGKIQELFSGGSILVARPSPPPAPAAPGAPSALGSPVESPKDAPPQAPNPYSSTVLANIALGVAFNNLGEEVRQLVPADLLPLAEQVNDSAAAQGLLKIDDKTMQALKDLTDPAHVQRQESVAQATQKLLNDKDAPDDFKAQALAIQKLAVYGAPDGQTADNDANR